MSPSIQYTSDLFWKTSTPFLQTDYDGLKKRIEKKQTTYEVITNDCNPKLYFDIDYKMSCDEYEIDTAERVETEGETYLFEALKLLTGVTPVISVGTSHSPDIGDGFGKYSVRYWVNNIKSTKADIKAFVEDLNKAILNMRDESFGSTWIYQYIDHETINGKLFDEGIYDSNRKMRCVHTSKPDQNRPLIIKKGSIENTIITGFYPEDCRTMTYKKADTTKRVAERTTGKKLDNMELYDVLLRDIVTNKGHDRGIWLSLTGWFLANYSREAYLNFIDPLWREQAENMYDSFNDESVPLYWIEKYAKQLNPEKYLEWLAQYKPSKYISTEDIIDPYRTAVVVSKTLKETLILCNEKWFMLTDSQLWKQQKEACFYIITEVRKYIDESNKRLVTKIALTSGDEKEKLIKMSKIYLAAYTLISQSGYLSVLTRNLKTLLADDRFAERLDNNPGKLAFKNGIMDLKTKVFRAGIQADDYITDTIPYDYSPSGYNYIKGVLKKILNNNDEHLDYYLSIIGFSFIGGPNTEKSLYFMIDKTGLGKGDNGKTFFFDILTSLMPNYVYKTKCSFLEKTNTKVHKQLAMMKGKRMVWMDEMPREKDTNAELMKELADGKQTENEVMHGTSESINVMFRLFALSNHIPKIDPNESAVYNRYKQISFNSHFDRTGSRVKECPEELKFIADTTLSTTIKEEYFNEVFNLVIDYAHKYFERKMPKIPEQFVADTKETQSKNDEFGSWFDDNCIIKEEGRTPMKLIMSLAVMSLKAVKEGMERKGFVFNKDLSKMGKDPFGKPYKGGFSGMMVLQEEEEKEGSVDEWVEE